MQVIILVSKNWFLFDYFLVVTCHLLIGEFYFEFSNFGSKMSSPLSYKLRCLAHELIRSILCYAVKLLTLALSCLNLSRLDTFGFLLHLFKPNQSLSLLLMHLQGIHKPSLFHFFHQASAQSIKNPIKSIGMKAHTINTFYHNWNIWKHPLPTTTTFEHTFHSISHLNFYIHFLLLHWGECVI